MPFQPAPDVAQVNIRYTRDGQQIENVWHVHKEGGFTLTDLTSIASTVNTVVPTVWMPKMPSNVVYQETNVVDLSVEGGPQVTQSVVGGQTGSIGGQPLPNNVTLAIRMKAGIGGRSGSGRIYWPGFAVGQMASANAVAPAEVADIIAAIQDLIDALNTLGYIVVILSRFLNSAARPEGVPFVVNTVSVFDNSIDAQRRRLPGRGA
jgi:hypothetical protein